MAIEQSTLTPTEILEKLGSAIPGTAKKGSSPETFKLMLQSKYGIDGQVLGGNGGVDQNMITGMEMLGDHSETGNEGEAALRMLGYGGAGQSVFGGMDGLDMLNTNALATLSKLTDDPALKAALLGRSASSGQDQNLDESNAADGSNVVRMSVKKNEVRMAVNRSAMHPDDLGRLAGLAAKGSNTGFTSSEEQLILAAAGAENLLAEATKTGNAEGAGQSQPVMVSSLERAAGKLSAQYESNGEIDCVGYDRRGGTSYGKYQIASKTGTMDLFVDFLEEKAPDLAEKLEKAGPANTGSKFGKMPKAWKEVAAADPARFEALQHEFIRENNYAPALKSIVLTSGTDVSERSYALREVLWSTAVQHGPSGAEKIFSKAIETAEAKGSGEDFDKSVIEEVYKIRSKQFGRHSRGIRAAVQARFKDEKSNAIALLEQNTA
jgi:hypothetical protein